jgi:hypothetical protein
MMLVFFYLLKSFSYPNISLQSLVEVNQAIARYKATEPPGHKVIKIKSHRDTKQQKYKAAKVKSRKGTKPQR